MCEYTELDQTGDLPEPAYSTNTPKRKSTRNMGPLCELSAMRATRKAGKSAGDSEGPWLGWPGRPGEMSRAPVEVRVVAARLIRP